MASDTKTVVVTSDALSYVYPGQPVPTPPNIYAYGAAGRGDEITIRAEDYDRFVALGAVVDPGTRAAEVARTSPRPYGPPVGAVPVATPSAKMLGENERDRWYTAPEERQDPDAVSAEAPAGVNALDLEALRALNVQQLKSVANSVGVLVEVEDTKDSLAEKISEQANRNMGTVAQARGVTDVGGQATGPGPTGPDPASARPATAEQLAKDEEARKAADEGGTTKSRGRGGTRRSGTRSRSKS